MKPKLSLVALLLICFVFALPNQVGHGQSSPRIEWEYKISFDANANNEKRLNELGTQGWELVGVRTTVFNGQTTGGHYYFKRAK
ncbi:MAG TPA: hypothetical protein VLM38_17110 [Blastocatellia bacterium]|nr:hypothetical protein [Blastocatellia bacterium]